MKLKTLNTANFEFEETLPKFLNGLGPDGCKSVFIKISGRAGGSFNPELAADFESLAIMAQVMDKQRDIIEKKAQTNEAAAKKLIDFAVKNNEKVSEDQTGIIYDNCVISWETNICGEDGEIIEPTRDNFIGLAQVKIKEIDKIFKDFIAKVGSVAVDLEKATEDDLKN